MVPLINLKYLLTYKPEDFNGYIWNRLLSLYNIRAVMIIKLNGKNTIPIVLLSTGPSLQPVM